MKVSLVRVGGKYAVGTCFPHSNVALLKVTRDACVYMLLMPFLFGYPLPSGRVGA